MNGREVLHPNYASYLQHMDYSCGAMKINCVIGTTEREGEGKRSYFVLPVHLLYAILTAFPILTPFVYAAVHFAIGRPAHLLSAFERTRKRFLSCEGFNEHQPNDHTKYTKRGDVTRVFSNLLYLERPPKQALLIQSVFPNFAAFQAGVPQEAQSIVGLFTSKAQWIR